MNKWIAIMTVVATATILGSSINRIESQQTEQIVIDDVLDSTTIALDLKMIPANDYLILYTSAPKIITSGSIVAKLPCDDSSEPKNWMLIGGVGVDLSPINLDLIQGTPGSMCAYTASIPNESAQNISGLVLVNTTSDPIRMPRTSSIVITVHGVSAP
ncbi:MAG: hypothetical protein HMLIMOIP_001232 [Candidatus Nitrosomirales archaeon]|jgi:hypothetical protein